LYQEEEEGGEILLNIELAVFLEEEEEEYQFKAVVWTLTYITC